MSREEEPISQRYNFFLALQTIYTFYGIVVVENLCTFGVLYPRLFMTPGELQHIRLYNQLLTLHELKEPREVVARMGAMQSQALDMTKRATVSLASTPLAPSRLVTVTGTSIWRVRRSASSRASTSCAPPGILWPRKIYGGCTRFPIPG